MRIRFGNCELDRDTRELLRGEKPVHLSPKGLQFLELLLDSRPRALSKAEIHERLWPGTFVTDGTLTSLLAEVRAAIEDDAHEPKFVRTLHRFGYAFSGAADEREAKRPVARARRSPRAPGEAYRLFCGPREIALEEGETILGRDPNATIFLDHRSVSRHHARISISEGKATIEDLGSKNGTHVGAERIGSATSLANGDSIRIGSVRMDFRVFPLSGSTETASSRS
jgi:DNA-binding winged helix-turn-helix (wHTH) protein